MRWILAVLLMLGWIAGLARAQSKPATDPSIFTPVETPTVNLDQWKTYQERPRADAFKIKPHESGKSQMALPFPKSIDLGTSKLEFDADRTRNVNVPGVATDSGETSNLSSVLQSRKQDRMQPNYFGLKLSTPTR
jgi:hypothetical protein